MLSVINSIVLEVCVVRGDDVVRVGLVCNMHHQGALGLVLCLLGAYQAHIGYVHRR
jgi:hypothetical protein